MNNERIQVGYVQASSNVQAPEVIASSKVQTPEILLTGVSPSRIKLHDNTNDVLSSISMQDTDFMFEPDINNPSNFTVIKNDPENLTDRSIAYNSVVVHKNNVNETVSGIKTFVSNIFAPNLVYNTGNQSITGIKTFNSNVIAPNLADQFPPSTGIRRYYPEGFVTMGTVTPQSGFAQYFPFLIKEDITNYNLCIEATTATATNIRLGIYSAASGMVNAPLLWTGTLATNAAQIFRISPNVPLTKGAYIIASANTGTVTAASYRAITINMYRCLFGENTGNANFTAGQTTTHYYSILPSAPNNDLLQRITGELITATAQGPLVAIEY